MLARRREAVVDALARARKIRPGMTLKILARDSVLLVEAVHGGKVWLRGPHSVEAWPCSIWALLRSLRSGHRAVVDVPCGPCGAPLGG